MVPRAKQALSRRIPNGKGKIAEQVFDAALTPGLIGAQDQLDVGDTARNLMALRFEARDQIALRVDTGVGDDPYLAVEAQRLMFMLGLVGGL